MSGPDREERCGGARHGYFSIQGALGPGGGLQIQLTLDRYGRFDAGGGGQIGKSPWLVSGGVVRGAMVGDMPSEGQLAAFLNGGPSINAGMGAGVGSNVVWSGNNVAFESGAMIPAQAGFGYTYSRLVGAVPWMSWGTGGCR